MIEIILNSLSSNYLQKSHNTLPKQEISEYLRRQAIIDTIFFFQDSW